jgi:CRISPR-associated protein Csb3
VSTRCRPLIELAAFVGLQRFRPFADPNENRYTFVVWREPLPPLLAAVAACGLLGAPGWRAFQFRLLYRTQYLKSFLPAHPIGDEK